MSSPSRQEGREPFPLWGGLSGSGLWGSPHASRCVLQTYTEKERIIVTQLPFPTTLVDLWALVWDYTCTSVVVLNQLQELDKVSSPSTALPSPGSLWGRAL